MQYVYVGLKYFNVNLRFVNPVYAQISTDGKSQMVTDEKVQITDPKHQINSNASMTGISNLKRLKYWNLGNWNLFPATLNPRLFNPAGR
jgi:hypothetical protein